MNNKIGDMIASSMAKIQDMVNVNSVIGQPIELPDGTTIIPVSKVKIGLGGGGGDYTTKNMKSDNPFGGGMGCGVNVDPICFLVIRDGSVRMLPVAEPASTTIDRVVEQAPDFLDKISDFLDGRKGDRGDK